MHFPASSSMGRPLLVVDDEPLVRSHLTSELQHMGFTVHEAGCTEEALQLARANGPFAAAFVDLALPGGSGLELISQLRALQSALPVVIASGYSEMALRDTGQDGQAPLVLGKPLDSRQLAHCMHELGLAS